MLLGLDEKQDCQRFSISGIARCFGGVLRYLLLPYCFSRQMFVYVRNSMLNFAKATSEIG